MTLKMANIAKMAHVSTSAVSLALNGKAGISQETREKIFKIIKQDMNLYARDVREEVEK